MGAVGDGTPTRLNVGLGRVRAMLGRLSKIAWYPALIAVVFVVEPLPEYQISPFDAARLAAGSLLVGVCLAALLGLIAGRDRGGALAALVVLALLMGSTLPRVAAFFAAGLLVAAEGYLSHRRKLTIAIPWPRMTEALSILLATIIVVQGATATVNCLGAPKIELSAGLPSTANPPDIVVILADAHGRRDILSDYYHYDMSPLVTAFGALGFNESEQSHANHVVTRFSLAVLLNGMPLSSLGQDLREPADERVPAAALRGAAVIEMLKGIGYHTVAVDAGYSEIRLSGADEVVDVGPWNELERTWLQQTVVGTWIAGDSWSVAVSQGQRAIRELDFVARYMASPSQVPQFVFVHVPKPHPPHVLNADCSAVPVAPAPESDSTGAPERIATAAAQTSCIDSEIAAAISSVVTSRPSAVVLVLSDHGPDDLLDWLDPGEPGLRNRFSNLFWARTPGHPGLFPEDVSLVNVFPILFNGYFGSEFSTFPDELLFGPTNDGRLLLPYRETEAPSPTVR